MHGVTNLNEVCVCVGGGGGVGGGGCCGLDLVMCNTWHFPGLKFISQSVGGYCGLSEVADHLRAL